MNFSRSEESVKAAKLLGAIVVVFGCAAWRVVGAVSPAPAAGTPPPAETVAAAPSSETPAAATTAAKSTDGEIEIPKLAMMPNVNPFRTIVGPPEAPVANSVPQPAGMSGALPLGPLPAATGGGPMLQSGPLVTAPPAQMVLRCTGILSGQNATAVIELSGQSQVVRIGGVLPDGSQVVRIDAATVTILRGKTTQVLDVGE